MRTKNWLAAAGLAALAALAALGGWLAYQRLHAPAAGRGAPERAADAALTTLDGGSARLSDYRGKLVLVNFWATWCSPCLQEIPLLVEAQDRYAARGLQILGPAMDDPEQVRQMLPRLRIQYPVLLGDTAIPDWMEALGDTLGALPYSVLVSPEGYVLDRRHGEFTAEELRALIESELPGA